VMIWTTAAHLIEEFSARWRALKPCRWRKAVNFR